MFFFIAWRLPPWTTIYSQSSSEDVKAAFLHRFYLVIFNMRMHQPKNGARLPEQRPPVPELARDT